VNPLDEDLCLRAGRTWMTVDIGFPMPRLILLVMSWRHRAQYQSFAISNTSSRKSIEVNQVSPQCLGMV
jgi:hypothetical protein